MNPLSLLFKAKKKGESKPSGSQKTRKGNFYNAFTIPVITGLTVAICFYLLITYKLLPGPPLTVRITDTSDLKFNSQTDHSLLSMTVVGQVSGIVSDKEASVFLLGRHVGSDYWKVSEASIDADGNWKAMYFNSASGMTYHPIQFWEFFAVVTKKPLELKSFVNPYSGAIRTEDIKRIKSVSCCNSVIRTWSNGVRVDHQIVPESRKYCQ